MNTTLDAEKVGANPVRVVAVSDLHGSLPALPFCDLLLIAGDICPVRGGHDPETQARWLRRSFGPWLDSLPAKEIVGVAGNHDFIFQDAPELVPPGLRWTYLQDCGSVAAGLRVWGSPWQTWFWDWAFNAPRNRRDGERFLSERWAMIPDDTEVLLLHGPPFNYGDTPTGGTHTGSPSLLERIDAMPRLQLVVAGHIHEGYGKWERQGKVIANVAYLDENYRPTHYISQFKVSREGLALLAHEGAA